MTDRERAFLLAAAAIIVCGTAAGALTGGPSGDGVRTVTRPDTVARSTSAAPKTATAPGGLAVTPPAAADAPDTLNELYDRDQVDNTLAQFGTVTIAKKTYEGVTMYVDRQGESGTPRLVIHTKGRYKRMEEVVGIKDDSECTENGANVSITNGNGERLWGPERVAFNSPKRFDVSIRNRVRVTLDQLSLAPRDNPCDGDADTAWGDVKFVK